MDDANYNFKHTNTAFINVVRKKLGLPAIGNLEGNVSRDFYLEVEDYLKEKFKNVVKIEDTYKTEYQNDIFFTYFNNEFQIKANLKMENSENLQHRFDAWSVS